MKIIVFLTLLIFSLALTCCANADNGSCAYENSTLSVELPLPPSVTEQSEAEPAITAAELYTMRTDNTPDWMDESFFVWCESFCDDAYIKLFNAFSDGFDGKFYDVLGATEKTLYDLYSSAADGADNIHIVSKRGEGEISLLFGGDVCLADDWENMAIYYERGESLDECLTARLLDITNAADLFMINNEFCYSDGGQPLDDKYYTFRAKPSNVELLKQMGVDIVSLANNHVYDYGFEGFSDTLSTLKEAGIPYVGAGENLSEAAKIQYFIIGGYKIAICAASRAEKYLLTPEATEKRGGVLRCYKPEKFIAVIEEAAENADFVIAVPHWGTEYSTILENAQTEQARLYVEAGADAVVGSHTHCLQGMEFIGNAPVMYSLGNFWFNHDDGDTALLRLTIEEGVMKASLIPCIQYDGITECVADTVKGDKILQYIESISVNAEITVDGTARIIP